MADRKTKLTQAASSPSLGRPKKKVFVIMPFSESPTRNREELAEFFEQQLRKNIENYRQFKFKYEVARSGEAFVINEQIIRDLFRADLVICDLSGEVANPNVMYELGVRLACSHRPLILIREESTSNRSIFDIQGLHVHSYNPRAYSSLNQYLRRKIRSFESEEEVFKSPVLSVLESEVEFQRVGRSKAKNLVDILQVALYSHLRSLIVTINNYLVGRSELRVTLLPAQLAKDLEEKREELMAVDWSEIKIATGPHPALSYYLSTQYLSGIIDDPIEIRFTKAFLAFYESYFINLAWWFNFDFNTMHSFVRSTTVLAFACGSLRTLLSTDEHDPARIEAQKWLNVALDFMLPPPTPPTQ